MSSDIGQHMQQLYSQFGQIPGISIELHKELVAVQVENQQASATVFLQGAQLSHYQKQAEPPIIWCSPLCDYQHGQPLRGGIPLCWPWFGELAQNPEPVRHQIGARAITEEPVAAHGFVRNRLWELRTIDQLDPGHTRLTLQLRLADGEEPLWPHACELQLIIDIGATLQLQLQIRNNSMQNVVFSSALHSYFAVANIDQVTVNGLQGLDYIDCLDNWTTHHQQAALTIDREIDRIYQGAHNEIVLVDASLQRTIHLHCKGSNSTVLWNPWRDKARQLSHFAADGYKQMLCIETANAGQDFVQLGSRECHQIALTISSSTIN